MDLARSSHSLRYHAFIIFLIGKFVWSQWTLKVKLGWLTRIFLYSNGTATESRFCFAKHRCILFHNIHVSFSDLLFTFIYIHWGTVFFFVIQPISLKFKKTYRLQRLMSQFLLAKNLFLFKWYKIFWNFLSGQNAFAKN